MYYFKLICFDTSLSRLQASKVFKYKI
jgi:hypothetical protein